jgi:hypothetical protein
MRIICHSFAYLELALNDIAAFTQSTSLLKNYNADFVRLGKSKNFLSFDFVTIFFQCRLLLFSSNNECQWGK